MYLRYPFASRAHRGQTRIYSFIVIATFISTLGYVATTQGSKITATVLTDIITYSQWGASYRPDGIFFDEAATSVAALPNYQTHSANGRASFVIGPVRTLL